MPEPRRDTFRTSGPGKTIWTLFSIVFGAARLPLWMLYYIPTFTRQHSKWTWKQAVAMRFLDTYLAWCSAVETKTPLNLQPGKEKEQWVLMSPAKSSYYTGITTQDPEIKPTQIGGTWYPSKPTKVDAGAYVVLHFHGGAFVIGDGRKDDTNFAAHTMIKYADVPHIFCPQYRLASNPGGRFPAALQDAITSYTYLVNEMGIKPSNIVIGGDSAGGNLTMAFLRYLSEYGSTINLEHPKCAWLWSPWVDPMHSIHDRGVIARSPNRLTDYLSDSFGTWGAECYAPDPKGSISMDSEYICFVKAAFKTNVPCWVSTGTAEVLFHDDIKFYELFKAVEGNRFELSLEEDVPHDIILTGMLNGFAEEAKAAAKKAGVFLRSL